MLGRAISYASWFVIVSACSGHNDTPLWASPPVTTPHVRRVWRRDVGDPQRGRVSDSH